MSFSFGNTATNNTWAGSTTATATISVSAGSVVFVTLSMTHSTSVGTFSPVTSPSLTWAKRATNTLLTNMVTETWWAYSAGALTNEVITATASIAPTQATIMVFECKGVINPSSPWSTNGSVPAYQVVGSTGTDIKVTGISSNTSTPVGLFLITSLNSVNSTAFGSWSHILTVTNDATFHNEQVLFAQSFVAAQSNATWDQGQTETFTIAIGDMFDVGAITGTYAALVAS